MSAGHAPLPCRCSKAGHVHGTVGAYAADKCRCGPCRRAKSAYARRQNRTVGAMVDASGPRDRLARLQAAGLSYAAIAGLTGLSVRTLAGLAAADKAQRPRFVFASTARALASVDYRDAAALPAGPRASVDPAQTRLQLQSLTASGWSAACIAAAAGIGVRTVYRILQGSSVTASARGRIDGAWEQLRDAVPPQDTPARQRTAARALARARANGWHPGMADATWAEAA